MKKRILSICLIVIMAYAIAATAQSIDNKPIEFVELDKNGNIVEVTELVYLESVAERLNNLSREAVQWPENTTYYNLASSNFTDYAKQNVTLYTCLRNFKCNSSNRLYYYVEVARSKPSIDFIELTPSGSGYDWEYIGSYILDEVSTHYERNGYLRNLSSDKYYTFGVFADLGDYYTNLNLEISWNSID